MAIFVIRAGFEPTTHSLEGCCSIQLSYRTDPYSHSRPAWAEFESGCKGNVFFRICKCFRSICMPKVGAFASVALFCHHLRSIL